MLIVGFEDLGNISGDLERQAKELQHEWKNTNEQLVGAREQVSKSRDIWKKIESNGPMNDTPADEVYSTATSTTTHMIRNADGSSHKETITTEQLSDGSTKTTRIVDTTPADGNSRTETSITTTPPPPRTASFPEPQDKDIPWQRYRRSLKPNESTEPAEELNKDEGSQKRGNGNSHKNSVWWFWSRK
jgi:hypothetical protein